MHHTSGYIQAAGSSPCRSEQGQQIKGHSGKQPLHSFFPGGFIRGADHQICKACHTENQACCRRHYQPVSQPIQQEHALPRLLQVIRQRKFQIYIKVKRIFLLRAQRIISYRRQLLTVKAYRLFYQRTASLIRLVLLPSEAAPNGPFFPTPPILQP